MRTEVTNQENNIATPEYDTIDKEILEQEWELLIDDDIIEEYKKGETNETTVWWHVQYKHLMFLVQSRTEMLTSIDNDDSGTEELKAKLLRELRRRPNPNKKQLEEFLQKMREQHQKQTSGKNEEEIQKNYEWTGMNEKVEKVMTQTKTEVCKRVESDMNNDDIAREVFERRMSAMQTYESRTGMGVDTAKQVYKQESESDREQEQTEQILGLLETETLPNSPSL